MSDAAAWLAAADRSSDWSGISATVAGLGSSGFAAADALLRVGARVTVLEAQRPGKDDDVLVKRADVLGTLGATVHLGAPDDVGVAGDLLVPSPGLRPTHPWIVRATAATTWSGEQLAWQLRPESTPWLTVTGTNGKTTTVQLVDAMLRAAGLRPLAAGNIGLPMAEAIFVEPGPEVFVVELSSYQLHFTPSLSATASALLNIAPDHLDWHGSLTEYVRDKSRVFQGTQKAIVYNHDDRRVEELAEDADVVEGCRAIGFTLGIPERSMVGVVDGVLVDRAFIAERSSHAVELVAIDALPDGSPPVVTDTLAAAALARSFGAPVEAVRGGALSFEVDAHRGETVDVVDEVAYVDNSKATNAHAADTALSATYHVVWIAGGLAKGGDFDSLVRRHRARLRGVVLIGVDQEPLREAFRRHAPEVPLIAVPAGDTDPMRSAVGAAAALAQRHDTVLLAPACASMDQFVDYRARGRAFAEAVAHLRR
ncbi:MAG TPA: UDP-N-acetylmuramoyl-L-alanine--D-glutamate ligase [Actinomycetes bacterium]|nr:UDP-N-acetylmuramoyl-L-alanine--D-glutamate ligase [Actinomycetes bacterium]